MYTLLVNGHCSVFYEIKGRYHCLFKKGFGPLRKVMEYEGRSIVLGAFLARTQETQKSLKGNTATQTNQERTMTTFLSHITPTHRTSQLRATQMDSRPAHSKWVTIDQAIGICRASRPWPPGPHLTTLSSTNKGHYLPPLQVLPLLQRPCHSGSTYARYLSKTKITIYLT